MTLSVITAFFSYSVITAFTPGPNNLLALSTTSNYGFAKSKKMLHGMAAGILSVMIICTIFCFSLASFLPKLIGPMKYAGALYILWLAWHVAISRPAKAGEAHKEPVFLSGFMLQFVNVKIMLYGVTTLIAFVLPYYKAPGVMVMFAVLMAAMGIAGNYTWALGGTLLQRFLNRYFRLFNIVMALLLVESAVGLILKK